MLLTLKHAASEVTMMGKKSKGQCQRGRVKFLSSQLLLRGQESAGCGTATGNEGFRRICQAVTVKL